MTSSHRDPMVNLESWAIMVRKETRWVCQYLCQCVFDCCYGDRAPGEDWDQTDQKETLAMW